MKVKLALILSLITLIFSPVSIASNAKVGAEYDSNQYVTILNLLGDPIQPSTNSTNWSDVRINYYDSIGECWDGHLIQYNADYTAGAGAKNGCKWYPHVGGINKIDIVPTQTDDFGNQIYEKITYPIDQPTDFYTVLLIKQDPKFPPVFDSRTREIVTPGKIQVDLYVLKTPAAATKK